MNATNVKTTSKNKYAPWLVAVLGVALVGGACGDKADDAGAETATATSDNGTATVTVEKDGDGPAGEIPADTRTPSDDVADAPTLPEGVDEKFALYFEKIPFVWGPEAGMAKAKAEGKPAMLFHTSPT